MADPMRAARIVIRADDTYPGIERTIPLSQEQADRIARFVHGLAPKTDTLFVHCHFGHGRSCGAAVAIARAFGMPWQEFLEGERVGNGHITFSVADALERLGYNCGEQPAVYDRVYLQHLTGAGRSSRLP